MLGKAVARARVFCFVVLKMSLPILMNRKQNLYLNEKAREFKGFALCFYASHAGTILRLKSISLALTFFVYEFLKNILSVIKRLALNSFQK